MLRKRIISVIEYLFFLGIGILLLWLSVRNLDLSAIWKDIQQATYGWLFIALFFALVSHVFRALRWNLLINTLGYKTRLSSTFFAVMIGYLANTAVPRMGEFARCGVLSKKEKIPFNTIFGTVISERIFDLVVLALLIFLVTIFQLDLLGDFMQRNFGPFFESLFTNIYSILIFIGALFLVFSALIYFIWLLREKIKAHKLYDPVRRFLDGLWNGIKTIKKMRQKGLFLVYTFLIWLFYALMVYLPFFVLPETSQLTFIDGLTVLAIGSLGIVAPVPGGIGAYHYIVKVTLTELYQVEANAAMSFATISHAGQTLLNILAGAASYFLIVLFSKKQKPLNESSRTYTHENS
ncbi:flippase-like domain-containing protein [bacterium]|nr:flippase-like domain-containing protein [bacterium]